MRDLTNTQGHALALYRRHVEKAATATSGDRRVSASEKVRLADEALTPHQHAIIAQVVVRGRTIAQLSDLTGRLPADLETLFIQACDALATHYEGQHA